MAPLEIIGAGMGRTGTGSLCDALNILGYNTHHMKTFNEAGGRAEMFTEAYDHPETQDEVDWDYLYDGFDAALDWPTCSFVVPLMKKYPDAKLILTVRDPDSWFKSMTNTLFRDRPQHMTEQPKTRMAKRIVLDGVHENKSMYKDKEGLIKKFLEHNEWIKQIVPKEKLLILELGEGWEPLCQFLDKPIPDVEYPHVNTTADMLERFGMKADKEVQEATITKK